MVSAAFYGPLQGLGVALRNAMNRGFGERYGEAWYGNGSPGLDRDTLERIANAGANSAATSEVEPWTISSLDAR